MNVSELFVRRPIATSLLMGAMGLFASWPTGPCGVRSADGRLPTISVSAKPAGRGPSHDGFDRGQPLERQFTGIAGIEEMTSSSTSGATTITLSFDLDRDIDGATVDVQTAIAAAIPLLPPSLTAPPQLRKTNPAEQPILAFVLTSNTLPNVGGDRLC